MMATEAIDAYAKWIEEMVEQGFRPYILTLMFKPLPGSAAAIRAQMAAITERAWSIYLLRTVRRPHSDFNHRRLPVWITAADLPVYKRERQLIRSVSINDGAHRQGFAMEPNVHRRNDTLDDHFAQNQRLYLRLSPGLDCIHAKPITHDIAKVADYLLKTVGRGEASDDRRFPIKSEGDRVTADDIMILPKARSEVAK